MLTANYKHFVLTIASLFVASASIAADARAIKMRSDDILFAADITKDSVANFIALYEAQEQKPTLVTVQSRGGDANAGLELGEFIFNRGLSVRVINFCVSSCANYVFTSGRVKYLTRNAVIGWHGSTISRSYTIAGKHLHVDCESNDGCTEELARKIVDASVDCSTVTNCEEARSKLEATFKATLDALVSRQHAFFKMIDVDERVTVYGQEIHCNCNWTFSVDDMRRFNIQNIKDGQPHHFMESSFSDILKQTKIKRTVKLLQLPAR